MITFKLKDALAKNEKTRYWLSKETGIDNNTLGKIYNGESKQIKTETLDKICKALNCPLTDIIEYIPD